VLVDGADVKRRENDKCRIGHRGKTCLGNKSNDMYENFDLAWGKKVVVRGFVE
jgi:hypothetical protein